MKITLRTDSIEVEGYVNAVGRDSRMLMDENGYSFREQIDPGTFAKALRAKADAQQEISLLLDHNQGRVLGGTGSNLILEEDSIGLMARATITDPEVIEKARNHQLRGWSFGFRRLDSREEYTSTCPAGSSSRRWIWLRLHWWMIRRFRPMPVHRYIHGPMEQRSIFRHVPWMEMCIPIGSRMRSFRRHRRLITVNITISSKS